MSTSSERGSVLIEALVASAIVAMLLSMTYQTIAGSAARARRGEASREAVLVAQSAMATVGSSSSVVTGSTTGVQGDLAWRAEVTPYPSGFAGSAAGRLYSLTVTVNRRSDARPLATLRSLRVGPA